MTQVTQEFSILLLRKEKTRPQLDKPETPHNTHGFQPYKARDRPVSDYPKRVGKRHSGESRGGVQRRVRVSHGTTESEIDPYPIVR